MAYIKLKNKDYGIVGLLETDTERAIILSSLAHSLLMCNRSIPNIQRELIAACVSFWNDCNFCFLSHGAMVCQHLHDEDFIREIAKLAKDVKLGRTSHYQNPTLFSRKLRLLLEVALKVQQNKWNYDEVVVAQKNGCNDTEIHDTVLITSAFCMYNRYVNGLGTYQPDDFCVYLEGAAKLISTGYQINKTEL